MKATRLVAYVCATTIIGISLQWSARAEGRFRFPVGFSYASGIHDATDKLFNAYEQDGFDVERIDIPIGLTLNPYYEWDTVIGAIGAGVTVGPTAFVVVDESVTDYYEDSSSTIKFSYAVPVGGYVRYTPWPKANVSPYVRGGVKYPFAGGDHFESSQAGLFGGVGVEFWRNKAVGLSIEVGYDASEIKIKYGGGHLGTVTFSGFTAGISVVF